MYIWQNFTGLHSRDNELMVETRIDGKLPHLGKDEQVIYPDFNQEYTYRGNLEMPEIRKIVESKGSIEFKVSLNFYNLLNLQIKT